MDRRAYDGFARDLVEALAAEPDVIGLVALGSMAATDREPDEWSDHDFWLVTTDGRAGSIRGRLDWLPRRSEIAIHFAETEHGRSAIYRDGHLVEYAVFDDRELEIARANAYRVLIDHCDLAARMLRIVEQTMAHVATERARSHDRLGTFLAQLTIGITRHARGERLSAHRLIRGHAFVVLCELLALTDARGRDQTLDDLDPTRRFEQARPLLAADLDDALTRPTLACAGALLDIAERELADALADRAPDALGAVRSTLARA